MSLHRRIVFAENLRPSAINRQMKIQKPELHFIVKNIFDRMNVRHPMGALQSFSIKNIFYDKINLKRLYFHVTNCLSCF